MSTGELVAAAKQQYHIESLEQEQKFVTMRVEGQVFGIAVKAVQDVLRRQRIAHVPLAPRVVAGSLNLRGRIVTAIDMRVRLGMPPFEDISAAMHVVVEYKNELYSLVVDGVGDVLNLPMKNFEKAPSNLSESWRNLAVGVFKLDKQLLVILDVHHIIWGK
jgi:purine-binding chemotaxis protein CheW